MMCTSPPGRRYRQPHDGTDVLTDDWGAGGNRGAGTMNAMEHASADEPREIDSAGLFAGHNEVIIVHKGGRYRLRITRQDKLILNK